MNDFDSIPFESNNDQNNQVNQVPVSNVTPQVANTNNILILDDRVKSIPAQNAKVTFKKTNIIFPVIAFIFVSIIGMYLFVSNSKADTINLIRIEENQKIGYIDNEGTIVQRAKYVYGTDFYKGYAIVKNNNNLYGVIDGKGSLEIPFGNYYYIGLFGNKYIVSKVTDNGLKQALFDSKLNEVTSFKYDNISYAKSGMYLFTRDETMGILNKDGKEIYSFKVDEVDDRNIDIEISEMDNDVSKYAKVKVNNSSTIINLSTGKEVYNYTLKDINVLKNNVFYIKSDKPEENSTYIIIKDDEIRLKTDNYKRVRIDNYDSDIAIGVNDDSSVSYINLLTKKEINENKNNDYSYGDGLVLEKTRDFNSNKDIYNIISSKKVLGTFSDYTPVNGIFYNGILNIKLYEGKYNYIDSDGYLLSNVAFDKTTDFNDNGFAIVSNDNLYGILNKKGKEIVPLSYPYLEFLDEDLFKLMSDKYNKKLFIYQDENRNYGLINDKDKIEIKAIYDSIEFITDKYPLVLVKYGNDSLLVNISTGKELPIKIESENIKIKDNYIIVDNKYYNYSGKLIYTVR